VKQPRTDEDNSANHTNRCGDEAGSPDAVEIREEGNKRRDQQAEADKEYAERRLPVFLLHAIKNHARCRWAFKKYEGVCSRSIRSAVRAEVVAGVTLAALL